MILPCTESSDVKCCNQEHAGASEKEIPCALLIEERCEQQIYYLKNYSTVILMVMSV